MILGKPCPTTGGRWPSCWQDVMKWLPVELGRQLYDSYSGPKWLHVEAHAGHNTLPYNPGAPWWGEVSSFLISSKETLLK